MGNHKSRPHDRSDRREQFLPTSSARLRFSWNWAVIVGSLGLLAALLFVSAAVPAPGGAPAELQPADVAPTGQDVQLPITSLAAGAARFFRYTTAAGREVRFFVMRSSDGVVRAAFDTCDVCYREHRGYRQEGDNMICNNCGRAFRSVDINVISGGCNPAPLQRAIAGDDVLITSAAIESGAIYF